MSDPDFPRGDGDPLGGPTLPTADEPALPDLYAAKIEFKVARVGWAVQTVVINFNDPEGEAEEHLLALWRIWFAEVEERARLAGGAGDIPIT